MNAHRVVNFDCQKIYVTFCSHETKMDFLILLLLKNCGLHSAKYLNAVELLKIRHICIVCVYCNCTMCSRPKGDEIIGISVSAFQDIDSQYQMILI